ncbi:FkbM family methyltransferase [Paraglaciecola sp. 25GB23A]|uniref:FkbM family methyltransferase n=1 Tax=Paraglaciecola sp. 25GB23A TaxID=3156068 RepID=UPI0032AFAEF7
MSETLKLAAGLAYKFDTVLIAGGGDGRSLSYLEKIDSKQFILLEPDPKAFTKLERQVKLLGLKNVYLKQQALIEQDAPAVKFYSASASEFSAVLPPQLIKKLRPGLIFEQIEVAATTLSQLVEEHNIDASKANLLIIDINGLELSSLTDEAMQQFSCLIIRASEKALYENVEKVSTLWKYYQQHSIPFLSIQEATPPYSHLITVRQANWAESTNQLITQQQLTNELQIQQQELQNKLVHTQQQVVVLEKSHNEAEKNNNEINEQHKNQLDKITIENDQLLENLTQSQATNAQLEQQLTEFKNKQSELVEGHKHKDGQIAELTQQRDQQKLRHDESHKRAEALKAQNEELSASSSHKQTENEHLVAQVADLQNKQHELAETQKNKDAKIAELIQQRDQQAKGHQETKQRAEALKVENEKLSADATQKQTTIEQMVAQVAALQSKQEELAETQKHKDAKIAELIQQRDQQANGHQETKQWAEALKVDNEKLSADATQKQTTIEQIAAQVTALQNKQNELVDGHKNKDAQIAELTKQYDLQKQGHEESRELIATLTLRNEKLDIDSSELQTKNEQLTIQVSELQTKQNELVDGHKNKDAQIAELTKQHDLQKQGHEESRELIATLSLQNEKLDIDSSELQTKQNELVESHRNKDAQIAEVTKQCEQQTHWHQENKKWAESLNKQCEELKTYSAERQRSADLALKLQTKAQIDLDNLREKYQIKHNNEQQLVDLVGELRTKLQQAAEYYYQLQESHPELSEVTQNQADIENVEALNVAEPMQSAPTIAKAKRIKPSKKKSRGK